MFSGTYRELLSLANAAAAKNNNNNTSLTH